MLIYYKTKKILNFLKLLDIASINNETDMLHPGTHMFWDNEDIRSKFMDYLAVWLKNPTIRTPPQEKKKVLKMMKKLSLAL